jgi:hypothetical protein
VLEYPTTLISNPAFTLRCWREKGANSPFTHPPQVFKLKNSGIYLSSFSVVAIYNQMICDVETVESIL